MKKVSAAEANRYFSSLLKQVAQGEPVLITSHGAPVATMVSANEGDPAKDFAKRALLSRLRFQSPDSDMSSATRTWKREELYEAEVEKDRPSSGKTA
jgi:prevent-host-death family protein